MTIYLTSTDTKIFDEFYATANFIGSLDLRLLYTKQSQNKTFKSKRDTSLQSKDTEKKTIKMRTLVVNSLLT